MRKVLTVFVLAAALLFTAACGETGFNASKGINVITREEGSGTRDAFVGLFGIEEKGADGNRHDRTTKEAVTARQTDIMLTNVGRDRRAIGYVSLGSLNDSVKALDIGGVQATADNVKNGSYEISRPFFLATKGEAQGLAKDFIAFILSAEGQAVVAAKSHIAIDDNAPAYAGKALSGKLVVAGSSSVTPVMEKLRETYLAANSGAVIEIQQGDSSGGLLAAGNGSCDIAMSSRELKDSELQSLVPVRIALDGVAVIVNPENPVDNLTKEQVRAVFTGEALTWEAVIP